MYTVYTGGGARDYSVGEPCVSSEQWARFRRATSNLLRTRGADAAAQHLDSLPFELRHGENFFGDDFAVLYAALPIEQYGDLVDRYSDPEVQQEFGVIARALSDICPVYVRFVALDTTLKDGIGPVEQPRLRITNQTVEDALADARQLIAARGSTSGVDRAHTAFHGYLRALCEDAGIDGVEDADVTKLYRELRNRHPCLMQTGAGGAEITHTLRALSTIVSVLNPLRNRASLAHPNADLLERAEADLVLNCIHTLLHYLNQKLN